MADCENRLAIQFYHISSSKTLDVVLETSEPEPFEEEDGDSHAMDIVVLALFNEIE